MLSKVLPKFILGSISFLLHIVNTLFWVVPILCFALLKLLLPIPFIRKIFDRLLNGCASNWISFNGLIFKLTKKIEWNVDLPSELSIDGWYLVMANHQSWVDIMVLQQVFNRKIPFLKFFLKQQLIWVPVCLGLHGGPSIFHLCEGIPSRLLRKTPT